MKKINFFSMIFFISSMPLLSMERRGALHSIKTIHLNRNKTLTQRRGYVVKTENYDIEAACYKKPVIESEEKEQFNLRNDCCSVTTNLFILYLELVSCCFSECLALFNESTHEGD